MTNQGSDSPFNRALDNLQFTFRILPIGVAEAGAWNYAFIYDLVPRHYPDLIEQAHPISEWEARRALIYRRSNPSARRGKPSCSACLAGRLPGGEGGAEAGRGGKAGRPAVEMEGSPGQLRVPPV